MQKLFLHKQGKPLGELELGPGVTTIGRGPDNDIILADRTVSARHACIHLTRGLATVQDLDSTNGTFVNGQRITTRPLDDGDVISIGLYRLSFSAGEGAPPGTGAGRPGP